MLCFIIKFTKYNNIYSIPNNKNYIINILLFIIKK